MMSKAELEAEHREQNISPQLRESIRQAIKRYSGH